MKSASRPLRKAFALGAVSLAALLGARSAVAQTPDPNLTDPSLIYDTSSWTVYDPTLAIEDPLHGFCWGPNRCADTGGNTPVFGPNPPHFGFWASPAPQTGDYRIDILVPNNAFTNPASVQFTITVMQGGVSNTSATFTRTSSLVTTSPLGPVWTSTTTNTNPQLATFLGISASPSNPLGAYLPWTQQHDPAATGFYVYQVDLGTNKLNGAPPIPTGVNAGPLLTISSNFPPVGALPAWSYIVGFLGETTTTKKKGVTTTTCCSWVATANSGALAIPGPTAGAGIPGIAFGAAALFAWWRRRERAASL